MSAPKPVDTVTGIFDLQGVGIRGFWRIKDILYELVQISDVGCLLVALARNDARC
jgi:hypothetical protein